jgi:hypothetical protein
MPQGNKPLARPNNKKLNGPVEDFRMRTIKKIALSGKIYLRKPDGHSTA